MLAVRGREIMSVWYVDGAGAKDDDSFGKICIVPVDGEPVIMDVLISGLTNNSAEYIAMRGALRSAESGDIIYTDSQLVVGQLTKGWSVNYEHLQRLHDECDQLMKEKEILVLWVSREKNPAGIALEKDRGREFPKDAVVRGQVFSADSFEIGTSEAILIDERGGFKKASGLKTVEKDDYISEDDYE